VKCAYCTRDAYDRCMGCGKMLCGYHLYNHVCAVKLPVRGW